MDFIISAIGLPLGYIMWFCYSLVKNYGLTIIVFTLITKLILFPVSLKVQKNSIKMVQIKPLLDEITLKYSGDKDKIAEEHERIYKEQNYSPAIGCFPTLIQIPIILGLINVIYNPMKHLLHLEQPIIDAFVQKAQSILGIENLGGAAQMKVIEMMKVPEYLQQFESMNLGQGVIEQVQSVNTMFFGLDLSQTPSIFHFNALILIPVLAGFTAFLLCVVQNKSNVLQAEQSLKSQYGMTIFMVVFSLYFTFIVPSGVGLYWSFSNLFAILQVYLLNAIYDPRKYIDYEAKEKMEKRMRKQKELDKKQALERKEFKGKEKADYKRFLDTENKQLVFYSEKNGFYKYFQDVIDYILEHSDIIIHYVTSDPKDMIFQKDNTKIVPYYIGDKKLITFMMKMDADMVVMTMPDLQQFHIKRSYVRKDIEYVYMFHYPLSTTMVLRKGALDYYDTIFCIGKFQFDEIRQTEKLYELPEKKLIECGYGLLESLLKQYDAMEKVQREHKKILIAPSWQTDNILDSCIYEILNQLLGKGYLVVVRPHPEYVKRYGDRMDAIVEHYEDYKGNDLIFELDFSDSSSIFNSDIVISDWSGTAYEFAFVTKKPAIFINTPPKINNPEYDKIEAKPLEITLRDKIGAQIEMNEFEMLPKEVERLFSSQEEYKETITNIVNQYISNLGKSGEIGGQYIIDKLKGNK